MWSENEQAKHQCKKEIIGMQYQTSVPHKVTPTNLSVCITLSQQTCLHSETVTYSNGVQ
jgi:hypothetical protein